MHNQSLAGFTAVAVYAGMIAVAVADGYSVTSARIIAVGLPGAGARYTNWHVPSQRTEFTISRNLPPIPRLAKCSIPTGCW